MQFTLRLDGATEPFALYTVPDRPLNGQTFLLTGMGRFEVVNSDPQVFDWARDYLINATDTIMRPVHGLLVKRVPDP